MSPARAASESRPLSRNRMPKPADFRLFGMGQKAASGATSVRMRSRPCSVKGAQAARAMPVCVQPGRSGLEPDQTVRALGGLEYPGLGDKPARGASGAATPGGTRGRATGA